MKKLIFSLTGLYIFSSPCLSQHPHEVSGEYQHGFGKNYTANSIAARYEAYDNNNSRNSNNSNKGSWSLGLNYTFSSSHVATETVKGRGFGVCAGYRYGLKYGLSGNLYGGIRTIFTRLNKYFLFTPSIEFGYHYTAQDFGKGGAFASFVAVGYDLKIAGDEKTKAVHDGIIFSPGISAGYRF